MADKIFKVSDGDEIIITVAQASRPAAGLLAPPIRRKAMIRLRQPDDLLPRRIRPDEDGGGDPHAPVNPPAPIIQLYRFFHSFEGVALYQDGRFPGSIASGYGANRRHWEFYAISSVPPRPGENTALPNLRRYRQYTTNFDGSTQYREYTRTRGVDLTENYDTITPNSNDPNRHTERVEVSDSFGGRFSQPAIVDFIFPVAFSVSQFPAGYYMTPAQVAANTTGDAQNWTFTDNPDPSALDYAFPG